MILDNDSSLIVQKLKLATKGEGDVSLERQSLPARETRAIFKRVPYCNLQDLPENLVEAEHIRGSDKKYASESLMRNIGKV